MTVRVPEIRFEDIFNNIKGMGELVSENMSGSDITRIQIRQPEWII